MHVRDCLRKAAHTPCRPPAVAGESGDNGGGGGGTGSRAGGDSCVAGNGAGGGIMIFCNTKASCSFVHEQLKAEGIEHASIHGDLPKDERFIQVTPALVAGYGCNHMLLARAHACSSCDCVSYLCAPVRVHVSLYQLHLSASAGVRPSIFSRVFHQMTPSASAMPFFSPAPPAAIISPR